MEKHIVGKTRIIIKNIIFFTFLTFAINVKSQTPVNREFNMQQGLPSYKVQCILQDNNGFIWLGTQHGLSYFDGYDFHNFYKEDGLFNNNILDLYLDEKGIIWIISEGLNVNFFKNGKLYKCNSGEKIKQQVFFPNLYIKNSFSVKNNYMSFAIDKYGIYKIDTAGNVIKQENENLYNGYNVTFRNKNNYYVINAFYSNNTLVVGKYKYKIEQNENTNLYVCKIQGLTIIANKETVKFFSCNKLVKEINLNSEIIGMKTTKNKLWVFTNTKGVFTYTSCYNTG